MSLVSYLWNCLSEKRHSHIGCICLTFLHCVFSNEPSDSMHGRIQSHIGCMCLTFLHCVFSNESSNSLPATMHKDIGCTCLTFLRCVFSNAPPNGLYKKLHSHIDCIYLTWWHFFHCRCVLCFPQKGCFKVSKMYDLLLVKNKKCWNTFTFSLSEVGMELQGQLKMTTGRGPNM